MIPICLVTGFLGSGKTTFLRQVVARNRERKLVYLVNELSPLDVDGALLREAEDDVLTIPGGSIFCRCLVTEFIGHLEAIPERFNTPEAPVEGVVIEASGIANPKVTEQLLAETGLDGTYDLASIVSIVDPGSFGKLVHTLPNIQAQVEAADTVLINKADLFAGAVLDVTENLVRQMNPRASVVRTVQCEADVPLFDQAPAREIEGDYAPCLDPNYDKLAVGVPGPVDLARLIAALRSAGEEIYRAKGFVPAREGMYYLDMSATGISADPTDRTDATAALAIVTRGGDNETARDLAARIEAGEFSASP